MIKFLGILGIHEFPYKTVGICVVFGILAAMIVAYVFREGLTGRPHIPIALVVIGALIGGFLGFCYHVVVGFCDMCLVQ